MLLDKRIVTLNNKIVTALLMNIMAFSSTYAVADDSAPSVINQSVDANDPCTVFLCMAGKVRGERPSECTGSNKTFFKIVKKKKGKFKPSQTFDARKSFLSNCPSADPKEVSKILSKFGKVR